MLSEYEHFTPPGPEVERRVDRLMSGLILEQKVRLLGGTGFTTQPIESADIPAFIMSDGPVGVHRKPEPTAYPATICLAAAWDRDLAYRYGSALGQDARAAGVHFVLGPALNIYRSPLCGRNFEYMGEDPYLAGQTAAAYVRGVQDRGVCATPKHFVLNFMEYKRYFASSDVDERTLRAVCASAFRRPIRDAGAGAVMSAYNLVNSVHCSEHPHLLREILKDDWEFQGLVMSDWVSTHSGLRAALGGLDLEMPTGEYMNAENLIPAVRDGRLPESVIDDKVRRILRVAVCFGWLDRPQKDEDIPAYSDLSREVTLQTARRGMVLLRNEDAILPLDFSGIGKIAVIGPSAHPAVTGGGGSSCVKPARTVSILDGISAAAHAEVRYAKGCDPWRQEEAWANAPFQTPDGEDGLLGHYYNNREFEGEPDVVRADNPMNLLWMLDPPEEGIDKENHSIRWTGSLRPERDGRDIFYFSAGDGEYRVRVGDEVLFEAWGEWESGPQRRYTTLSADRDYEVCIEFRPVRAYNWVQFGWEHEDAVWPEREKALEIAREADLVIYCGGHSKFSEGENFDRASGMPEEAEELLLEVLEQGTDTVVVLTGGGNIDMRAWADRVKAILHAWYPGQEGGTAVADILLGKVNPSGKLPVTFEERLEDRSSHDSYHDEDGDDRVELKDGVFGGYRHFDREGVEPRFPFGFGLSYTEFEYGNLRLSTETVGPGESVDVTFEIANTGERAGAEVAQVYVSDPEASVPRPVKELKNYARVELEPGERKSVTVSIEPEDLEFYDMEADRWVAEPGTFEVLVGASCADIRLRGSFELTED